MRAGRRHHFLDKVLKLLNDFSCSFDRKSTLQMKLSYGKYGLIWYYFQAKVTLHIRRLLWSLSTVSTLINFSLEETLVAVLTLHIWVKSNFFLSASDITLTACRVICYELVVKTVKKWINLYNFFLFVLKAVSFECTLRRGVDY